MTRRHLIAVAISLGVIALALAQPMWIRMTGTEVALGIRPVDPLSLFRGNYVDLAYDVDVSVDDITDSLQYGAPAYVVFDDARPANAIRVAVSRPALGPNETCIRGEYRGGHRVVLPSLEQFFVTPDEGARLEGNLSSMVGIVKTTGSCRAVLVALEATDQP